MPEITRKWYVMRLLRGMWEVHDYDTFPKANAAFETWKQLEWPVILTSLMAEELRGFHV